jgi:DNA polymerase III alpha subunit
MYLNCKTYFSFRYGTISIKELLAAAEERGVTTLAIRTSIQPAIYGIL